MNFTETLDLIARNTNSQNTTTSSYSTAAKTVDVNSALNWFFILANQAAGNWRPVDDTNQTDYPVVLFDLVSGQQDYSFTVDENGNQIVDIEKVRVKDAGGVNWLTLKQINKDELTDDDLNTDISGVPTRYYLTANGIFLVEKPNYNSTDGGEIHVSRTGSYFTTSDTTKKAGIPWVFHEYLALRPSYFYCLQKGLKQATNYKVSLDEMEAAIKKHYSRRNRDFQISISGEYIDSI